MGLFQEGSINDLTFDSGATEDMTIMNKAEDVESDVTVNPPKYDGKKSKEYKPMEPICFDLIGGI